MGVTLADINAMERAQFVRQLGEVFEHSPWVAERAFDAAPFASVDALHDAMCAAMQAATPTQQLALICAHPELAGRAAVRSALTSASAGEQHGAGLDQCSAEEHAQLTALNDAYRQRFGFPFIIAVRGHTRTSIIAAMAERMDNGRAHEFDEALHQIGRIAAFRLAAMIEAD